MQLADFGLKTCNVLPDRADSVGVSMRASDLCGSYSSGAKKLNYAAAGGALNWLTAWLAYTHTQTHSQTVGHTHMLGMIKRSQRHCFSTCS